MARVLGIDPGLTGALVLIDTVGATLACEPMPRVWVKRSGKQKRVIDELAIANLLYSWAPDECWIEDVYSMPGEGHSGAFTFGLGKGVLMGTIAGCTRRRPLYVAPQVWKHDIKCPNSGHLITRRCNQLFPQCAKLLKSEGKREAAMITLWGALKSGHTIPGSLVPAGLLASD
jgi:hypothetical protein